MEKEKKAEKKNYSFCRKDKIFMENTDCGFSTFTFMFFFLFLLLPSAFCFRHQ